MYGGYYTTVLWGQKFFFDPMIVEREARGVERAERFRFDRAVGRPALQTPPVSSAVRSGKKEKTATSPPTTCMSISYDMHMQIGLVYSTAVYSKQQQQ